MLVNPALQATVFKITPYVVFCKFTELNCLANKILRFMGKSTDKYFCYKKIYMCKKIDNI